MDADLDTLCTVVYCTADDLLPEARANARRQVTDAELVTLCVAQAIMGIPSDRRFLAVAASASSISSRSCPARPATPSAVAASLTRSSGSWRTSRSRARALATNCCSSTRPRSSAAEAGRRSSVRPSAESAGYGYCAAHSRWFWGFRLHPLRA